MAVDQRSADPVSFCEKAVDARDRVRRVIAHPFVLPPNSWRRQKHVSHVCRASLSGIRADIIIIHHYPDTGFASHYEIFGHTIPRATLRCRAP